MTADGKKTDVRTPSPRETGRETPSGSRLDILRRLAGEQGALHRPVPSSPVFNLLHQQKPH